MNRSQASVKTRIVCGFLIPSGVAANASSAAWAAWSLAAS